MHNNPMMLLGYFSYRNAAANISQTAAEASLGTMKQVNKFLIASLKNIEDTSSQFINENDYRTYTLSVDPNITSRYLYQVHSPTASQIFFSGIIT